MRARADEDEALRVKAMMLKGVEEWALRRVSIRARPCLPVAPVTRRVFGVAIARAGQVIESQETLILEGSVFQGAGMKNGDQPPFCTCFSPLHSYHHLFSAMTNPNSQARHRHCAIAG